MGQHAIIIGASGGIGAALVQAFAQDPTWETVHAVARGAIDTSALGATVMAHQGDVTDEQSLLPLAQSLPPADLVIVATGLLSQGETLRPEKSLRQQEVSHFERLFAVNTIGPALVAKHFLPKLPRDRRVTFAALSARVGSIGDNRLGGWHGYRASKAALNMLIKCYAIELQRWNAQSICVGLHPGTVRTALSAPFRSNVAPQNLQSPEQSAHRLKQVLAELSPADSGACFDWAGAQIPP